MSFQFSLDDVNFLMSPIGQQLLVECAQLPLTDMAFANWLTKKRETHSAQQTSAVLETTQLRRLAERKWGGTCLAVIVYP